MLILIMVIRQQLVIRHIILELKLLIIKQLVIRHIILELKLLIIIMVSELLIWLQVHIQRFQLILIKKHIQLRFLFLEHTRYRFFIQVLILRIIFKLELAQ